MTSITGNILPHIFLFISLYFEIFLLITFLEKRREIARKAAEPSHFPTVTVIVPCFNEERTVAATLESLFALDYPKEKLSIFVVDDGSTDSSWRLLQVLKDHPQITLFQKENGGKYTALNLGLTHSKSELVGCLDADSFVDSQALKRIVSRFEDSATMAV